MEEAHTRVMEAADAMAWLSTHPPRISARDAYLAEMKKFQQNQYAAYQAIILKSHLDFFQHIGVDIASAPVTTYWEFLCNPRNQSLVQFLSSIFYKAAGAMVEK